MSITGIIFAALIVGGVGLFIGVFLGVAGQKFAVEVDERETKYVMRFRAIIAAAVDTQGAPDLLPRL